MPCFHSKKPQSSFAEATQLQLCDVCLVVVCDQERKVISTNSWVRSSCKQQSIAELAYLFEEFKLSSISLGTQPQLDCTDQNDLMLDSG